MSDDRLKWLRGYLANEVITEDERAMWTDAGFYIPNILDKDNEDKDWNPVPRIIRADELYTPLTLAAARSLRQSVIDRWERTKKSSPEKVRVVEVDQIRDSLEARNDNK